MFDNRKHYYVGRDELKKLLAKGSGWLSGHPEKEEIARRYLTFQPSLYRQALERLADESSGGGPSPDGETRRATPPRPNSKSR